MKRYIAWFFYLSKHRYYVFIECLKRGIPFRGILHDLDKYLPEQFIPYAKFHFNPDGSRIDRRDSTGYYDAFANDDKAFQRSIYLHWRRSKHHWESWVIPYKNEYNVFPMDNKSIMEMICDWIGAGKANGTPDTMKWWNKNKDKLILHEDTRTKVEFLLTKEFE